MDIVFDSPPGPVSERFIEVEDGEGHSIDQGEWIERDDGLWALRLPSHADLTAKLVTLEKLRIALDLFLAESYNPNQRPMRDLNRAYEDWRDAQPVPLRRSTTERLIDTCCPGCLETHPPDEDCPVCRCGAPIADLAHDNHTPVSVGNYRDSMKHVSPIAENEETKT